VRGEAKASDHAPAWVRLRDEAARKTRKPATRKTAARRHAASA
jgi:hypothetical protein